MIQIHAVHLYGYAGKVRSLRFRLGKMNIITGASKRGKTALFDIIDYCLASESYRVPEGVIRNVVSAFAVELETPQGNVIAARRAPKANVATTSTMHVSFRPYDEKHAPALDDIESNADISSARDFLSGVTGIEDNQTDVGGGSRASFRANIRHSLYFVFQGQSEIANRDILFHSQGEEWVPQAIRDVFPYFLGAVDPEYVWKQQRLRSQERELRVLRRNSEESQAITRVAGRARGLVREAIQVGLLDQVDPSTQDDAIRLLGESLVDREDWNAASEIDGDVDSEVPVLLEERSVLREELSKLRSESKNLSQLLAAHLDYNGEAFEQRARLASLGLLKVAVEPEAQAGGNCPVCDSVLDQPLPGVVEIQRRLQELDSEIAGVSRGVPHIQEVLAQNSASIQELSDRLRVNQNQLDAAITSQDELRQLQDFAMRRAAVRGRISLYLESVDEDLAVRGSTQRISDLQAEVDSLRAQLDAEGVADRLSSALSRISVTMTNVAQDLELEHADTPVRLDIRQLTVVVDTDRGPRVLNQMGSGANWVGYHLTALIGLHKYFVESNRPVPRFMCLDQPSQTYFPADPGAGMVGRDEDSQAVLKLVEALDDLVTGADGRLQVIVADHADFPEDVFRNAVIARWRGDGDDAALVPPSWL